MLHVISRSENDLKKKNVSYFNHTGYKDKAIISKTIRKEWFC